MFRVKADGLDVSLLGDEGDARGLCLLRLGLSGCWSAWNFDMETLESLFEESGLYPASDLLVHVLVTYLFPPTG